MSGKICDVYQYCKEYRASLYIFSVYLYGRWRDVIGVILVQCFDNEDDTDWLQVFLIKYAYAEICFIYLESSRAPGHFNANILLHPLDAVRFTHFRWPALKNLGDEKNKRSPIFFTPQKAKKFTYVKEVYHAKYSSRPHPLTMPMIVTFLHKQLQLKTSIYCMFCTQKRTDGLRFAETLWMQVQENTHGFQGFSWGRGKRCWIEWWVG